MAELNKIEETFVKELLQEHGDYLKKLLATSIIRNNIVLTQELLNSLHFSVDQNSDGYHLNLSFLSYGRAVEIQGNKNMIAKRRMGYDKQNAMRSIEKASQKDKRFYSKNAFGSLNRLLGRMSSGYSDEEIARIKELLNEFGDIPVL